MILERLQVGVYGANCYIVGCKKNGEAIIVDPGGDSDTIIKKINELGLKVKYIILTHGHGDHIGALLKLKDSIKAPILIHSQDKSLLMDADKNLSSMMSGGRIEIEPDKVLEDGDILLFGDLKAEIIHTPGHTKGSICIKVEKILLSGDTLFAGSIGRTDFPGGSFEEIIFSIKNKILKHEDDIVVYPGHGPATSIGKERKSNPFII